MRNRMLMVAAMAGLCMTGAAQAEGPASDQPVSLRPVYLQDAPAATTAPDTTFDRPIMALFKLGGLEQPMRDLRLNVFGYVEGSFTHNFDMPDQGNIENKGHLFDWKHDKPLLNQIDISVERLVDVTKWDVGGRFDFIYGSDSRWIHGNGLFDYHNDDINPPHDQWDLTQAYLDFNVPVGRGLGIRFGKFVGLAGAEVIDPTKNVFFSHSFLFNFATPFTQTGLLVSYQLTDELTVKGGVTRGWDQATEDNNSAIDVVGQVSWNSGPLVAAFTAIVGPEQNNTNRNYRTLLDLVATYTASDSWAFTVNPTYVYEDGGAPTGQAQWYGVAAYATYTPNGNKYINFSVRGEWFRDNEGVRYLSEGQPFQNTGATGLGVNANFYEITLGATWTPFAENSLGKNFKIRPEVRYDYSDRPAFDDVRQHQQVTVGMDLYMQL